MLYLTIVTTTTNQVSQTSSVNTSLNLLGWLLGFVIAGTVVTIVAWPMLNVKSWTRRTKKGEQRQLELDAIRDRLETEQLALDELEFDYEAGGLAQTDYEQLKNNSQNIIRQIELEIAGRKQQLIEYTQSPTVELPSHSKSERELVAASSTLKNKALSLTESEALHRRAAVKKAMHCSECGTPFKAADKFCAKCGAPLPIICQNCGTELSPDDRFCAKCGATVRQRL
jgi:hypothetical protein